MALTRVNNQALTNVTSAGLPSGTVLQVKSSTINTTAGDLTNTYTDQGLSVTITPSSSSNKIFILMHTQVQAASTVGIGFQLLRGSTVILNPCPVDGAGPLGWYSGSGSMYGPVTMQYLDSPSTTSATTYKMQAARRSSGTAHFLYDDSTVGTAVITAMEIAG